MPNYFYVKSGGTAGTTTGDGRSTTPRTGSFGAMGVGTYYDNVDAAVKDNKGANNPVDGDFIIVSDLHSHTYPTGNIFYDGPNNGLVSIISVADVDVGVYKKGASEEMPDTISGGIFVGVDSGESFHMYGFAIGSGRSIDLAGTYDSSITRLYYDCDINLLSILATNALNLGGVSANSRAEYHNCNFVVTNGDTVSQVLMQGGGRIDFYNCVFSGARWSPLWRNLGKDPLIVNFYNCDFSQTELFFADSIFFTNYLPIHTIAQINFHRCAMPAVAGAAGFIAPYNNGISVNAFTTQVNLFSCTNLYDTDNHDAYYYSLKQTLFGTVDTDITEYLNATYDGVNGFSRQLSTVADSIKEAGNVVSTDLITLVDQNMTVGRTITVEFISADAGLTDKDFWIEVAYPNETNHAEADVVSGRSAQLYPLDSGGAAHTASASGWNVGTGTAYKQSVVIPAQAGGTAFGVIRVSALLRKASTDVNVDPKVTVS